MSKTKLDINRLLSMSNDNISFDSNGRSIVIKSLFFRYADFLRIDKIESITAEGSTIEVRIPNGSQMGDHEISVNMKTGIVTADGKTFDEPLPDYVRKPTPLKKPKKGTFTPSINGFSIKDVQTMPSEDGYACSCKIMFNGEVVGDFLDKGDGSEYQFWADPPYSSSKIDAVIRSFPPTTRDYGMGPMTIEYDMNQMVNDLMEMSEIAKEIGKLKEWQDYVLIDDWIDGCCYSMKPQATISNEELSRIIAQQMGKTNPVCYRIRRFKSLDSLITVNTFVINELLK